MIVAILNEQICFDGNYFNVNNIMFRPFVEGSLFNLGERLKNR